MIRILGSIGGTIFFAVMLTHVGSNFYENLVERKAYSRRGWEATQVNGKPTIYTVDADGPAVALHSGDEVVSLAVEPQNACPILNRNECTVPAGTGYKLVIRRDGETLAFDLATAPDRLSSQLIDFAAYLLIATFVITGLTILLLKPDDKQVWLLALMLGTFTGFFSSGSLAFLPNWAQFLSQLARGCANAFFPLFLHFFLIFPQSGPWVRRFPRLVFWLYVPFLILILPINIVQRLGGQNLIAAIPGTKFISIFAALLIITYLVLGLAVMAVNYRAADSVNRRRTRVILVGCGTGVLSFLLLIGSQMLGLNRTYPKVFDLFIYAMLATLPLIPLSIVYAIIRHQVIPISLLMRRGVRYLLVSRGSILLELIVVIVAVTAVLTYIFSRSKPSGMVIGLVSAGVGVSAWKISETLHDKYLAPLIDRRFFRQSYDAHQIIAELTHSLRTVTELPQLLDLVATKIQSALQTEHVTIFLRDTVTGNFNSAYSNDNSGSRIAAPHPQDGHLVRYARMVEHLDHLGKFMSGSKISEYRKLESDNGRPVEIGHDDFFSEYDGAALLMPLLSKDEMLGIVSLGPRLGDLPFSREDKQLLMSVSGPTTLAIENARLVEQMVTEARRLQEIEVDHRRKTEELVVARQLQLSMLPTRNIMLGNIEIIGRMRTASEVGGDYYDFIEMTEGRICIAVGDATGHGMAAGLVVGMVKMGLINGLPKLNGSMSIKPLVEDLNRALKRSLSRRGMGMCLGAAILETSTLKVQLFSNGMPAPYHYRFADRNLLQIATHAPPLGFLREVSVRPVEIQMQSGDALLWLSDGFEERLNRVNEVWGENMLRRRWSAFVVMNRPLTSSSYGCSKPATWQLRAVAITTT